MAQEMLLSNLVTETGALGTAQKIGGVTPEAIQGAVDDWLEDHPEATTTVQDGAITNAKLDATLQAAVGVSHLEGELFTAEDWITGYLGSANVTTNAPNGDKMTKRAARVYAGETITVKIAIPLGSSYCYWFYNFVAGENDMTYVGTRVAGASNGKYTSSDESYRYYDATITVEADGWFICSYRPNGLDMDVSSIQGTVDSCRLGELEDKVTVAEAEIDVLQADAANDVYSRFPEDGMLPIASAHRGMARSGLPENTIPALAACAEDGWSWVETDARLTSDGKWVCLHDESINRTARNEDGTALSSTVNIADITLSEAQAYDFGVYAGAEYAGTAIMTLDECVMYCRMRHLCLQIDIKSSSWSKAQMESMWAIVRKYGMQRRTMLVASSIGCVDDILALDPYVPVAVTAGSWTAVDPADYADTTPYANGAKTGKNKVYVEISAAAFSSKAAMDNMVDYFRSWGIHPGVYGPVSEADIEACSDRLDICCGQYVKYDDTKAAELE
ncbi:MAG: hypothetical protein IJK29_11065 [Bacteroidales bacterium]|nr:hypothetical protein [Bacteroidales bacterium]